jgi:phage shock protein PspC (stress-responsive transcriptional regulator)
MSTTDDTPTEPTPPASRPRLLRSSSDKMIAGVAAGIGRYFGIDPVIVRVIAVALVFFGGAGILLYLAAWLLVPSDSGPAPQIRGRTATIAGAILLALAIVVLLPWDNHWGAGFGFVAFLFLLGLAGVGLWRLASSGSRAHGGTADVLRRVGIGISLVALCSLLAVGGAWAVAAGGGTAVAIGVLVLAAALIAGAFFGHARWLILPALALALPATAMAAADIDVKGGIGERTYRPATTQDLRDKYRLGIGRLVLDLRNTDLSPGTHRTRVELGVGQALVLVPEDVCVSTHAHVAGGAVTLFNEESGGGDFDFEDGRRAPSGTPLLELDGDVGFGALEVHHQDPDRTHFGPNDEVGNVACEGGR